MRFVDTNVLLYSVSTRPDESVKAARARQVMKERDLMLSVQALQEFYVQAIRPNRPAPLTHDEAVAFIRTWMRFPVQDVTLALMQDALETKARYQLSYWDAATIAAARAGGCAEVLSEDMSAGQDYGGMTVVNPLVD